MSYAKMMKWGRTHRGKSQYMGFNPSGITSEQIQERENKFVKEMKLKTLDERQKYWEQIKQIIKNWEHSWEWEWCVFQRTFTYNNEVS